MVTATAAWLPACLPAAVRVLASLGFGSPPAFSFLLAFPFFFSLFLTAAFVCLAILYRLRLRVAIFSL
jgi:hypothetical protein